MIISKEQLQFHVCSGDSSRPEICKICFDKSGAISTDGKRLLVVPYPKLPDDELFESEQTKADAKYEIPDGERACISSENSRHVASNFFKYSEVKNPDQTFAAMEKCENESVKISLTNGDLHKEFLIDASSQTFPEYSQIIPRSEPTFETMFDTSLLIDLLRKIKGADAGNSKYVKIRFHGEAGLAELVTVSESDHEPIRAFIMPVRNNEE